MSVHDTDYYRQRADEELAAAEKASDDAVSNIHREMARRYREMPEARSVPVEIFEVRKSLNGMSAA